MKLASLSYCKKLQTLIITMLLVGSIMIPIAAYAEINSTGTYFWVSPSTNIVETPTQNITIDVMIEDAPETYAWEFSLRFNNTALSVVKVDEGPWLASGGKSTSFFYTSLATANAQGSLTVGCTLIGEVPGASDDGVLCTITFTVLDCGRSELDLYDSYLVDMADETTYYPNNDGFFCADCALDCLHDVAIVDVTLNVTGTVDQGTIIEVNVTIHNEGSHNQTVTVKAYAEKITHDPLDPDVVLVGDEILIGEQSGIFAEICIETSVYFNWNTALVPGEVYTICAEVIKPDDNDTHDNKFIGPEVRVRCPHDLDIVDVTVLPENIEGLNLIGVAAGLTAKINVTVLNEGSNSETFDIVVHANGIDITHHVTTSLAPDAQKTYTVNWLTTLNQSDIYTISAEVTPVTDEKDTDDNGPIEADEKIWVIIDDGAIVDYTTVVKGTYRGFIVVCADISGGLDVTVKNEGTRHYYSTVTILISGTEVCVGAIDVAYGKNRTVSTWSSAESLNTTTLAPGAYDISALLEFMH
jgi:hypothetical protein